MQQCCAPNRGCWQVDEAHLGVIAEVPLIGHAIADVSDLVIFSKLVQQGSDGETYPVCAGLRSVERTHQDSHFDSDPLPMREVSDSAARPFTSITRSSSDARGS